MRHHHFNAKLSYHDVHCILARIEAGEFQKDLAAEYGVCPATISAMKRQHTYSKIKHKPAQKQTSQH